MNLSVIETENLENEQAALGCFVSIDNKLLDIITPLTSNNPENSIPIPSGGTIGLVIKDMRKDVVLGNFTEEIENFSSNSTLWCDLVSNLNPKPRILLCFNALNAVRDEKTTVLNDTNLLNKINELQTTIMELEYKLDLEKEEKIREINSKSKILENVQIGNEITIEQLKFKINNSYSIIEELQIQNKHFSLLCIKESEKNKILEQKINNINHKYEEIIERIKNNESEYLKENCYLQEELRKTKEALNYELCQKSVKEILISQLSYKLNNAKITEFIETNFKERIDSLAENLEKSEIRNVQNQKIILENSNFQITSEKCEKCEGHSQEIAEFNEELNKLKTKMIENKTSVHLITELKDRTLFQDNEIECLRSELSTKNRKLIELQESNKELFKKCNELEAENKEISEECSELKRRIITLTKNSEILEREITELKCKSITAKKLEKIRLDDIDISLENYLSEQGIENLFVKLAHGVYLYGTKRVNISLRNDDRLICRIGGGYTPIDQFLKLYQNTEIEEISKYVKKQSLFLSQGASPIRKNKRALSSTPENSSRKNSPKENSTERNFENKIIDKLRGLYPLKDRNFTPLSRSKLK